MQKTQMWYNCSNPTCNQKTVNKDYCFCCGHVFCYSCLVVRHKEFVCRDCKNTDKFKWKLEEKILKEI